MKFYYSVFVLSFICSITHAASEKLLGPVVAVERTYKVDLKKLSDSCEAGQGPDVIQANCEVKEFTTNGTEQLGSHSLLRYYSTHGYQVVFEATELGYRASVGYPTGGLTLQMATSALSEAFQYFGLATGSVSSTVHLVK